MAVRAHVAESRERALLVDDDNRLSRDLKRETTPRLRRRVPQAGGLPGRAEEVLDFPLVPVRGVIGRRRQQMVEFSLK